MFVKQNPDFNIVSCILILVELKVNQEVKANSSLIIDEAFAATSLMDNDTSFDFMLFDDIMMPPSPTLGGENNFIHTDYNLDDFDMFLGIPDPFEYAPMAAAPMVPAPMAATPMAATPMVPAPMAATPMAAAPMVPAPMVPAPMVPAPMAATPMAADKKRERTLTDETDYHSKANKRKRIEESQTIRENVVTNKHLLATGACTIFKRVGTDDGSTIQLDELNALMTNLFKLFEIIDEKP